MKPFVPTENHTGILGEESLSRLSGARQPRHGGIQMSAVVKTNVLPVGADSASLRVRFSQRQQSRSAHSNSTHRWLDGGCAQPPGSPGPLQLPAYLAAPAPSLPGPTQLFGQLERQPQQNDNDPVLQHEPTVPVSKNRENFPRQTSISVSFTKKTEDKEGGWLEEIYHFTFQVDQVWLPSKNTEEAHKKLPWIHRVPSI